MVDISIDEIKSRRDKVIEYSRGYISDSEIERFKSFIDEKLNNFKPSLMVYGTYNAGKSTLLNALFGQDEMAKTGDAPETFKVTEYKYNGYTLYDTPGINAPIEHELITEEHLKKSELILFVLSNDGSFEEKFVYEKIANVVKMGKPILIVVNNKKGTKKNSKEELEELKKINENLRKIGDELGIKDIEKKVDIVVVNAKSALKAKIDNKKLLLKSSNISQLEDKIDKLLSSSSSKNVINTIVDNINEFIDKVIDEINSKIEDKNLRRVEELKAEVEKLKKASSVKLYETIKKDASIAANELRELLLNQDREVIDRFINDIVNKTQSYIERELRNIQDELRVKIEDFNRDIKNINVEKSRLQINNIDITPEDRVSKGSDFDIGDLIGKSLPDIIATLPVKIPMAIVNIATMLISLFVGSSKEKELAEAKLEAKRESYMIAKNKADSFAHEFEKAFKQAIDETLNSLFNDIIKNLNSSSLKLSSENREIEMIKNRLNSLKINR